MTTRPDKAKPHLRMHVRGTQKACDRTALASRLEMCEDARRPRPTLMGNAKHRRKREVLVPDPNLKSLFLSV
jgi:hypothetical protein